MTSRMSGLDTAEGELVPAGAVEVRDRAGREPLVGFEDFHGIDAGGAAGGDEGCCQAGGG